VEGDITINLEWVEYQVRKCDVILPLVAIATPATYVREPLRVFELDFEANLPIIRPLRQVQETRGLPLDFGGLRGEPGQGVRSRHHGTRARPPSTSSAGFIPA